MLKGRFNMKKIFMILIISFMFASSVCADVYIVYDKDTKEVVSISSENDCVVQSNMELKIEKDIGLKSVQLANKPNMYKYIGGKFELNYDKAIAKEAEDTANYEKNLENEMINQKIKDMAIEALKAEGKVFKHYDKSVK